MRIRRVLDGVNEGGVADDDSVGLTLTTSPDDLTDALWRADAALYAAKATGRDAVRSWNA